MTEDDYDLGSPGIDKKSLSLYRDLTKIQDAYNENLELNENLVRQSVDNLKHKLEVLEEEARRIKEMEMEKESDVSDYSYQNDETISNNQHHQDESEFDGHHEESEFDSHQQESEFEGQLEESEFDGHCEESEFDDGQLEESEFDDGQLEESEFNENSDDNESDTSDEDSEINNQGENSEFDEPNEEITIEDLPENFSNFQSSAPSTTNISPAPTLPHRTVTDLRTGKEYIESSSRSFPNNKIRKDSYYNSTDNDLEEHFNSLPNPSSYWEESEPESEIVIPDTTPRQLVHGYNGYGEEDADITSIEDLDGISEEELDNLDENAKIAYLEYLREERDRLQVEQQLLELELQKRISVNSAELNELDHVLNSEVESELINGDEIQRDNEEGDSDFKSNYSDSNADNSDSNISDEDLTDVERDMLRNYHENLKKIPSHYV